jgi:dipeptidase E
MGSSGGSWSNLRPGKLIRQQEQAHEGRWQRPVPCLCCEATLRCLVLPTPGLDGLSYVLVPTWIAEEPVPDPRLLLLSNSTMPGEGYLAWARSHICDFLGPGVRRVFFVPFAGVTISWDDYTTRVREAFGALGYEVTGAHERGDPMAALRGSDAVAVGGGNTFQLLAELHATGLLGAIGDAARNGMPYIGWSAGSNVACPTIRTTNDMPIVEPPGLSALGLVPFQINAHYTEARLGHHGGETRVDRLNEFVRANPGMPVVGLPEGTALRLEGGELALVGEADAVVYGLDGGPRRVDAEGLKKLGLLEATHRP